MSLRQRTTLGYRGHQVLVFIQEAITTHGQAPSYSMIRDHLGFGDEAGVCRCVQVLERRGFIRRVGHGRQRRIRLLDNK